MASLALSNAACELGHSCTDIGCQSGVSVSVITKSGEWQDGHYRVALSLDDRTVACTFTLPDRLPAPGSRSSLDCGDSVHGELSSGAEGSVTLHLALPDPNTLQIDLSRDGSRVLSESPLLSYRENQPNPGCVPICRNATVHLTID